MNDNKEQYTLVIFKPDALVKMITGNIISRLSEARLRIIGAKVVKVTPELAKKHYEHLVDKPFFQDLYEYFSGRVYGHDYERVLAFVYTGHDAIRLVRQIAGATNPLDADPVTVRGAYGRITKNGVMENVIHCSDSEASSEREIKLWFDKDEIIDDIYPGEWEKI